MYHHEWNLFEEGGDLFLLQAGAPLVFEVNQKNCGQWTWPELRGFLDQSLSESPPVLQKPLPVKPRFYKVWELSERLICCKVLISWTSAEVGHIHVDELLEKARTFLQQVDAPTYRAIEQRNQLKEHGLLFDGSWMPSTIGEIVVILSQLGVYPLSGKSAPWQFQEKVTAKNGALITLYEVRCLGWGFALRGLEQQDVIRELKAFLSYQEHSIPDKKQGE